MLVLGKEYKMKEVLSKRRHIQNIFLIDKAKRIPRNLENINI